MPRFDKRQTVTKVAGRPQAKFGPASPIRWSVRTTFPDRSCIECANWKPAGFIQGGLWRTPRNAPTLPVAVLPPPTRNTAAPIARGWGTRQKLCARAVIRIARDTCNPRPASVLLSNDPGAGGRRASRRPSECLLPYHHLWRDGMEVRCPARRQEREQNYHVTQRLAYLMLGKMRPASADEVPQVPYGIDGKERDRFEPDADGDSPEQAYIGGRMGNSLHLVLGW